MKTAEEFFKQEKNYCEEAMEGVSSEYIDIMQKYAEYYHIVKLRNKYKPAFCKACQFWTVIDALGGEYCRVLEKPINSPRNDFKHRDCPL